MSPIYKTFFGTYIDLSKLISIGSAYYEEYATVSFKINFQSQEQLLKYSRGTDIDNNTEACLENLQKQVEEIIQAWKDYKEYCLTNSIDN